MVALHDCKYLNTNLKLTQIINFKLMKSIKKCEKNGRIFKTF